MLNENNNSNTNNSDFQAEIENKTDIISQNEIDGSSSNTDLTSSENNNDCSVTESKYLEENNECTKEDKPVEETASVSIDNTYTNSDTESVDNENKNCTLDHKKDDKLKNLSYGCIPFILTAIVISLFNIGRVRQPLSFLFLALGLLELAITYFIRSKKVATSCGCKKCIHQSKALFKYALFYGIATLGLLGVFIYFLVV